MESVYADETGWHEPLADKKVTYHIGIDGRLVLIENVPARVNVETGSDTLRRRRLSACSRRFGDGVGRFGLLRHRFMSMGHWSEELGDFATVL